MCAIHMGEGRHRDNKEESIMKKGLGLSIVVFAGCDDSNSETMKNISESIKEDAYDKGWNCVQLYRFNSILIRSVLYSIMFNVPVTHTFTSLWLNSFKQKVDLFSFIF